MCVINLIHYRLNALHSNGFVQQQFTGIAHWQTVVYFS